jgi:putative flippase GtrA
VQSLKRVLGLFTSPTEKLLLQVPRALIASVLAAAVDFGLLIGLKEGAGWDPVLAAVVSYLVGGVVQYVLCASWVFPAAPQSVAVGFTAFTFLSLVGLAITYATMVVLCDWWHVNYAVAKIAALGLAFGWNFLSRKFWLFRSRPTAVPAEEPQPFADQPLTSGYPFSRQPRTPPSIDRTLV